MAAEQNKVSPAQEALWVAEQKLAEEKFKLAPIEVKEWLADQKSAVHDSEEERKHAKAGDAA